MDDSRKTTEPSPPITGASYSKSHLIVFALAFALVGGAIIYKSFAAETPVYRTTDFKTDPGWIGINNKLDTSNCTSRAFNFGWKSTNNAGAANGEIGGRIDNSSTYMAYYGKKLSPAKTLNDKLTASGTMMMPHFNDEQVLLGWFNSSSSIDWRAGDFYGMRFSDGVGDKNRVYGDFMTHNNYGTDGFNLGTTGTDALLISPGQRFSWSMTYDPAQGTSGTTTMSVTLNGKIKSLSLPVSAKQRADGSTFDHFGLLNLQLGGRPGASYKEAYVDDVQVNSGTNGATESFNFDSDPGWDGSNNQLNAKDCKILGNNSFGWSSNTTHAGGAAGEIGGWLWMSDKKASYADRVGPLTMNDTLYVSGKIVLNSINTDTDIPWVGWFNSANDQFGTTTTIKNFVGGRITGTASSGYGIHPAHFTSASNGGVSATNGLLRLTPKKESKTFSICYNPSADTNGNASLTIKVNGESVTQPITPAEKTIGASFDRFGFVNQVADSRSSTVYVDDLRYTVSPGDSAPGCGQTPGNPHPPGDINNDGKVDLLDLSRMTAHWKTTSSGANFDSASDLNHDNSINIIDLSILARSLVP